MELGKSERVRGRPRSFDVDGAVEVAQAMFHDRGYDQVSVGDLAGAMGIAPPSFYSAFGSKAGLFQRVLERYDEGDALPLTRMLLPERLVPDALGDLLIEAAELYTADPTRLGCLALEGARCSDAEVRAAAEKASARTRDAVGALLADLPGEHDDVADLINVILAGMSAMSRRGVDRKRLVAVATGARPAITALMEPRF